MFISLPPSLLFLDLNEASTLPIAHFPPNLIYLKLDLEISSGSAETIPALPSSLLYLTFGSIQKKENQEKKKKNAKKNSKKETQRKCEKTVKENTKKKRKIDMLKRPTEIFDVPICSKKFRSLYFWHCGISGSVEK